MGFNPRPGHATGATHHHDIKRHSDYVSIRAPVTRPGRPNTTAALAEISKFQSAPRSRDRGDFRENFSLAARAVFQSAPRSRDRGDALPGRCLPNNRRFNPRPGHATGATFSFMLIVPP